MDIYQSEIWKAMMSGEEYDATNAELVAELVRVRGILHRYNSLPPTEEGEMTEILKSLLGGTGENLTVNQPFRCDYGHNITVGENFFANFNFTVLDEAAVTIGDNAFIGPNVSIYTACHPIDGEQRRTRREWSKPVTIGNDVWIGGSATILPGVTIGDNVTIGAGSVVTKDVPSGEVWAGNPARFIKKA